MERAKSGELQWSPESLTEAEVDRYLAETQCREGDDVDEFFQPWRNREWDSAGQLVPSSEAMPLDDPSKPRLCTQEEALQTLHRAGYDVDRAVRELSARNLVWSAKKRDIEAWDDQDLYKFELNMRLSKPFHDLPNHVPGKSVKQIMHFYYTWKKTPRYANWRKRRSQGLVIREQAPVIIDAPTGAPLKEDEFAALRQFMGLRSRPRVDYSQSSSGGHIWRSTTSGFKRKQRNDDESSDTDDEKHKLPLTVYDVRIEADINLEALRMAKRRRVNTDGSYSLDPSLPVPSDQDLLMEVEQQQQDLVTRYASGISDYPEESDMRDWD